MGIIDNGANRNRQFNIMAVASGSIAPLALPAALRFVLRVVPEMKQGVVMFAGNQDDIAAPASIAAARPASRNVLLAAERKASITAVAGLHLDDNFINEHANKTKGRRREPGGLDLNSALATN
jgi:hypothetical protein